MAEPYDDLRIRIAAALSQHDAFGTDFVECLCGKEFDNAQVQANEFQPVWELHVADAVIRELGLTIQVAGPDGIAYGKHRYITDWIAND